MNTEVKTEDSRSLVVRELGRTTRIVNRIFKVIFLTVYVFSVVVCIYWMVASDRYVSEAVVLVQNTETGSSSTPADLLSMFAGGSGSKTDQLLLIEFLTSIDMLNKLDKELDLRSHYSDTNADIISRLWSKDISTEWFYKYFQKRVAVTYDDFSGVVRISAQAFDPETATKITTLLVQNGEEFMNKLSHKIADDQVKFLSEQTDIAKNELLAANEKLLEFQNRRNMVSPSTEVQNYQTLIAGLEKQKSELMVKIASLPANLGTHNQIRDSLNKNVNAIDEQIAQLRQKVTNANDKVSALNELADEENLLKLDVEFKKEIYSSTLSGLAKGKLSAARLIKNVGILQSPSKPQYAMKPERIYCIATTMVVMLLVLGMLQLLKAVILDHVD
ncbi:MAG: hypothetical protein ACI4V7_10710 [Succinivibrionaceae bacterium]